VHHVHDKPQVAERPRQELGSDKAPAQTPPPH